MQRGFDVESCAGIHVLQALAKIEQTDRGHFVLDNETRTQLDAYLTSKLQQAVERQQPDGAWNEQWCDAVSVADEGTSPFPKRFLVTGHLLEVMNVLQSSRRPAGTVYVRAAEWLKQSINSDEIRPNGSWVCPFTHGARAAREILRPAKISLSGADTFHHTE